MTSRLCPSCLEKYWKKQPTTTPHLMHCFLSCCFVQAAGKCDWDDSKFRRTWSGSENYSSNIYMPVFEVRSTPNHYIKGVGTDDQTMLLHTLQQKNDVGDAIQIWQAWSRSADVSKLLSFRPLRGMASTYSPWTNELSHIPGDVMEEKVAVSSNSEVSEPSAWEDNWQRWCEAWSVDCYASITFFALHRWWVVFANRWNARGGAWAMRGVWQCSVLWNVISKW